METGADFFAKKIITASRLEITQPDFNSSVMQKIMLAERKKAMKRALLCCFLGLSSLGIAIFLAVVTMQQNNYSLQQFGSTILQKTAQLCRENQIVLLPLIVLFISQLFTKRKTRSYHVPDLNF
ncbi:MAG: hypothetical protein V4539_03965 [Bacteroidota bacterium]